MMPSWSIPTIRPRVKGRKLALARRALELGHVAGFMHTGLEPHEARTILRSAGWSTSKLDKLEQKGNR